MAARPTVNVRGIDGVATGSLPLPAVFTAPIRPDVIQGVHSTYPIASDTVESHTKGSSFVCFRLILQR